MVMHHQRFYFCLVFDNRLDVRRAEFQVRDSAIWLNTFYFFVDFMNINASSCDSVGFPIAVTLVWTQLRFKFYCCSLPHTATYSAPPTRNYHYTFTVTGRLHTHAHLILHNTIRYEQMFHKFRL